MSRLTSTSVYLEDAQLTRLREVSSALRRPMAGLIREAIADWLLEREASAVDSELLAAQVTKRAALAQDEGQEKGPGVVLCKQCLHPSHEGDCPEEKSDWMRRMRKEYPLPEDGLESGSAERVLNVNPD